VAFQSAQRLVERDEVVIPGHGINEIFGKVNAQPSAAVFVGLFAPGLIYEDAAHGLGGGGKEVAAAVPRMVCRCIDKSQVGFMHKCRRLERLSRFFLCQPLRREFAEFVVNERQQLLGSVRFALFDGGQDAGDI
jgi:hypothetical protein